MILIYEVRTTDGCLEHAAATRQEAQAVADVLYRHFGLACKVVARLIETTATA